MKSGKRKISKKRLILIIFLIITLMELNLSMGLGYKVHNHDFETNNMSVPSWGYNDIKISNDLAFLSIPHSFYANVFPWVNSLELWSLKNSKRPVFLDSISFNLSFPHFSGANLFVYNDYIFYPICFDYGSSAIAGFKIIRCNENSLQEVGSFQLNNSYWMSGDKIIVENNIAYFVATKETFSYLMPISIINLSAPFSISLYNTTGYIHSIIKDGNIIYLLKSLNYETTFIEIINVQDILNPYLVSSYPLNISYPIKFIKKGLHFFILGRNEMSVFNLDLNSTQLLLEYGEDMSFFKDLLLDKNLLYCVNRDELFIYNITEINDFRLLGNCLNRKQGYGFYHKMEKRNDYLYIIRISEKEERFFFVFDCSNPNNPRKIYPLGYVFHDFWLYVGWFSIYYSIILAGITTLIVVFSPLIRRRYKTKKENIK